MARTQTPPTEGEPDLLAAETGEGAAETTQTEGEAAELPPEVLHQIELAAENLEKATTEVARLTEALDVANAESARLSAELDTANLTVSDLSGKLSAEVSAHRSTRDRLDAALLAADGEPVPEVEASDDWVADGLFVMLNSKTPDATGSLAPRGRLAIIEDARAERLVETGQVRPATRADLRRATRPPVRL